MNHNIMNWVNNRTTTSSTADVNRADAILIQPAWPHDKEFRWSKSRADRGWLR